MSYNVRLCKNNYHYYTFNDIILQEKNSKMGKKMVLSRGLTRDLKEALFSNN